MVHWLVRFTCESIGGSLCVHLPCYLVCITYSAAAHLSLKVFAGESGVWKLGSVFFAFADFAAEVNAFVYMSSCIYIVLI